jgi:excisionase family DNA binding protein
MEAEIETDILERDTFTLHELAERLEKPYSTVRDAAKRGQIPTVRIGRAWLVPRDTYGRWLACEWHPSVVKESGRRRRKINAFST